MNAAALGTTSANVPSGGAAAAPLFADATKKLTKGVKKDADSAPNNGQMGADLGQEMDELANIIAMHSTQPLGSCQRYRFIAPKGIF